MQKTNLLHLITGLGVGGAERVVLDLASYGDASQYTIKVVSLSGRVEMLPQFLERGVATTSLIKDTGFRGIFEIVKFLNNYIHKNKIDIIHAHMAHAMITAGIIKMFNPKVKIVFTSHSMNIGSQMREILIFLLKPFRSVDILFSNDYVHYYCTKKHAIIPNGIKLENYSLEVEKEKRFTFLAVGRLEDVKNHRLLIECAKNLKKTLDFVIWIAGEGYLRKELEDLIKKYALEKHVKLLGLRNDIPVLLNRVHCFVMSSSWEGLPIAILEAGAAGLPVISTPVGNIPSVLNNGNAFLAKEEEFENNMKLVIIEYSVALKKAKYLKSEITQNYSIEAIVQKHQSVYQELIGNK